MAKLFKKKAGGHPLLEKLTTRVEGGRPMFNLARNIGDKFSGGMVSKLIPPSSKADVERQQAKREKNHAKPVITEAKATVIEAPQQRSAEAVTPVVDTNLNPKVKMLDKIKNFKNDSPKGFWGTVIGVVLVVAGIIYKVVKGKNAKTVKKF